MGILDRLAKLRRRFHDARLERRIDAAVAPERAALEAARRATPAWDGSGDPLVSITIPTYNRGELVAKRTIPSALAQTYRNIEVVVVGDHCTDGTAEFIAAIGDPRVRFENLAERGRYPDDAKLRWMVAGSVPLNRAIELARGAWLAHLDDDDVYAPDKIERLLRSAQERDLEFIFGRYRYEKTPGVWVEGRTTTFPTGRPPYGRIGLPHSGILYRSYLRAFRYYENAWEFGLPTDNLRWLRMAKAGVRAGFIDHQTCLVPLRPGESAMAIDAVGFSVVPPPAKPS